MNTPKNYFVPFPKEITEGISEELSKPETEPIQESTDRTRASKPNYFVSFDETLLKLIREEFSQSEIIEGQN